MSYSDAISEILNRPATLVAVDTNSEVVEQAGVKGMKWGVRRSEDQLDAAAGRSDAPGKGVGSAALSGLGWAKPGAAQAAGAPPAKDGVVTIAGSGVSGQYSQTELDEMAEDLTEEEKKKYEEYLKGLKPGAKAYSLIEYQLHIRSRINMKSTKDPGLLGDKSNYVDMKDLIKQGYTFSAQYQHNGRDDSAGVLEPKQLMFPADRKEAKEDAEKRQQIIDERTRKHSSVKHDEFGDGLTIAQAGVKGMKWGVRRDRKGGIKARATVHRKDARNEAWASEAIGRSATQSQAYQAVYRSAASKIRQGTRALNKSEEFRKQDFRTDTPLRRKYYDEYSKMVTTQLNAAATRTGRSPDGRLELRFEFDANNDLAPTASIRRRDTRTGQNAQRADAKSEIKTAKAENRAAATVRREERREIKHADGADEADYKVHLEFDDMGYITNLTEATVAHALDMFGSIKLSDLDNGETIAQAGIKGMKWGVRRTPEQLGRAKGKSADSDDGDTAPAKPKASAPAKKSTKSMSDTELREALNRLQMEKQYQQLTAPDKSKNLVGEILRQTGGQVAKNVLTSVATAYIGRAVNVNLNRALPDAYRVPIAEAKKKD